MTREERHKALCEEIHETYLKKNSDYGNSFHDTYQKFGIISALTRITDKYNRLVNLGLDKDKICLVDEKIEDTCIDLAGYLLLLIMELEDDYKNV